MTDAQYDLFFSGQLLDGYFEDFVKADLKTLFRTDDAYIDRLFNGQLQTLKTQVDKATAVRFQQAFKKAGAKLIVRPHDAQASVPAKSPPAQREPKAQTRTDASSTPAPDFTTTVSAVAGENDSRLIEHHQPDLTPPGQIPAWDVAAPGTDLTLPSEAVTTHIDTNHLSLASAGSTLTEAQWEAPAVSISTDHLSVAPPGSDLETLTDDEPTVEVDISHLTAC